MPRSNLRSRRPRRKMRKARMYRSPRALVKTQQHFFTEMFKVPNGITASTAGSAGGLLNLTFNNIPQAPYYQQLFRQFCVKHITWMLLPRISSVDLGTLTYNFNTVSAVSPMLPRFVWSIADTPSLNVPTSELDVLQDNGSKVTTVNKRVTIKHRPVPDIGNTTNSYTLPGKKQVWFNTANVGNAYDGQSVKHGSIRYWVTAPNVSAVSAQPVNIELYDIFCKVTVAFRDPA